MNTVAFADGAERAYNDAYDGIDFSQSTNIQWRIDQYGLNILIFRCNQKFAPGEIPPEDHDYQITGMFQSVLPDDLTDFIKRHASPIPSTHQDYYERLQEKQDKVIIAIIDGRGNVYEMQMPEWAKNIQTGIAKGNIQLTPAHPGDHEIFRTYARERCLGPIS